MSAIHVLFSLDVNCRFWIECILQTIHYPLTTLIDTLVIEVVTREQIIVRECYDRCIVDPSRKSFMVELYTLEWSNCRNFAKM